MKKTAIIFVSAIAVASQAMAAGDSERAKDVMQKVAGVYSHLSSIRVSVKFEITQVTGAQHGIAAADYDLATQGKDYFLRFKQNGAEGIVASDGENTWKALVSGKQYSRVEAAAADAGEDDESADEPRNDLYGSVSAAVFTQYPALARAAREPEIVREADYKVAKGSGQRKVRCYVLRMRAGKLEEELWVDKDSFLVLQRTQKSSTVTGSSEVHIRVTSIEVNQTLPDSTFRLEPAKGWSEVEMLLFPGERNLMLTGSRAANFALKTLEGDPAELAQARGKVVVLDFWATWCPPCRKEMPYIEKLRTEFADKVVIYGVNDESAGTVRDFVKKNHYEMTVLMDGKKQVNRLYGVTAIPTLLIIDKDGIIRKAYVGSRDEATLRQAIQSVVESK